VALALSVEEQDARLRAECPQFKLVAHGEWVGVWEGTLRPVCQTYRVRIVYYSRWMFPGFDLANPIISVYVLDPPIGVNPRGTGEPPQHVYRNRSRPDFPRLCIYDPRDDNWRPTEHIVDRIIPWTIKWLFFHEEWVASGVWHGGGRHPELSECPTPQDNLDPARRAQQEQSLTVAFHCLGQRIGLSASSLSMAAALEAFFPLQPSRLLSVSTPEEIRSRIISTLQWGPRLAASSRSGWERAWKPPTSSIFISIADATSSIPKKAAA
jgi:hypothetical protein